MAGRRSSLLLSLVIVVGCIMGACSGKYILGIEGYCLNACAQLRLDLVKLNLPDPIPPEHLFQVVAPRPDTVQMGLGRFSAYDAANQIYYFLTVEQLSDSDLYVLYIADVTQQNTVNVTLELWDTAVLSSIQWDPTSLQLYAVVDNLMCTINTKNGTFTVIGHIAELKYLPQLPSSFDSTTGNYFITAYNMDAATYHVLTYNIYKKSTIITKAVGGTNPARACWPIELTFVPIQNQLWMLTDSKYGGGMEKVDWQTGTEEIIVESGEFPTPFDVIDLQENKNQESCFDPVDNWWYLEMWDYTEIDFPEGVLYPYDVTENKWASGAWSVSDDVSNWEFVAE
ncbi:hypothetical protein Pelo_986 [Pelomyxa schiedti]|nr:hypothetical protein Pelo_986 [Pelomyxa schiedti]